MRMEAEQRLWYDSYCLISPGGWLQMRGWQYNQQLKFTKRAWEWTHTLMNSCGAIPNAFSICRLTVDVAYDTELHSMAKHILHLHYKVKQGKYDNGMLIQQDWTSFHGKVRLNITIIIMIIISLFLHTFTLWIPLGIILVESVHEIISLFQPIRYCCTHVNNQSCIVRKCQLLISYSSCDSQPNYTWLSTAYVYIRWLIQV